MSARALREVHVRDVFVHRLMFLSGGTVVLGSACDDPTKKFQSATPARHSGGAHLTSRTTSGRRNAC
jgi:hypothetical protein